MKTKNPNAGATIGRTAYNAMLASFREFHGNVARAAAAAGVSRRTARRAWSEGWPARKLPAIIDVLREEQVLARSRRKAATLVADGVEALPETPGSANASRFAGGTGPEAAELLAKDDAAEARAHEGQMVKLSRANTIALMSATSRLLSAGIDKAKELEKALRLETIDFTPKEIQKFISSLGYLTAKAAEAAKMNIEMERILLGEPTEIIGMDLKKMSLEDAARTIELANKALARARSRGLVPAATPDLSEADLPPSDPDRLH